LEWLDQSFFLIIIIILEEYNYFLVLWKVIKKILYLVKCNYENFKCILFNDVKLFINFIYFNYIWNEYIVYIKYIPKILLNDKDNIVLNLIYFKIF